MDALIEPTLPIGAASIALVKQSFARVAPQADAAAQLFYAKLFDAHPELRRLFKGDMATQGAKLMSMLAAAINMLDRPWALAPVLRQLGERHGHYGVQPWHYDAVGQALIETLQGALGPALSPQDREAWIYVYGCIAKAMQSAAPATLETPS